MSDKIFLKYFSKDFVGINAECSAIEPEGDEVNRAVNLEWAPSNNLRGRTGRQLVGSPGGFYGIHAHNFALTQNRYSLLFHTSDPKLRSTATTITGATTIEPLALNVQLFRLSTLTVKVTIVNAATYSWYTYVKNSKIYFNIKKNGVEILDYDCGTGFEVPGTAGGLKTIYDLLVAIDALADLSVTLDRTNVGPFGISDATGARPAGGVSDLGQGYTFLVKAAPAHTFQVNDPIVMWNTTGNFLVGGYYMSTGSPTTFDVDLPLQPSVYDGQVLGYLGQPAASFPIQSAYSSSSSPLNIQFPYWEFIPSPVNKRTSNPFEASRICAFAKQTYRHYKPPSFNSMNGNCYIAATDYVASPGIGSSSGYKYDTNSYYGSGWPTPAAPTVVAGALAIAAGTYKYKYFLRRIDSQGNIIDSNPSPVHTHVSVGGAGSSAAITIPTASLANTKYAWFHCYSKDHLGGGAPQVIGLGTGGPIDVSSRSAAQSRCLLAIGMPIVFYDAAGVLHRTYITQIDQSAAGAVPSVTYIYVADTSAFTINENTIMSGGVTAMLLRTAIGGNTYYQRMEIPIAYYSAALTSASLDDNLADATLIAGVRYIEIENGKEHDPPPQHTLICEHQGLQVYSGNPLQPNTVAYSLPGEPEYVPLATHNFDVPSTQAGNITAVASDTVDRLAVFKEASYYDVSGDLDGGTFSIQTKSEHDYGIASHKSLVRIGDALYGMSRLGVIVISNGNYSTQFARKLNARILNQLWYYEWSVAANDPETRNYVVSVPSGLDLYGNVVTKTYVIDYSRENVSFLEQEFVNCNPSGGWIYANRVLYQLSFDKVTSLSQYPIGTVYRRLQRFSGDSPTANDGDSFIDHVSAISYVLETQPINFGEPSILKTPIRLRVYSIPNEGIIDGWVPWSCVIKTTIFPDTTYLGSGYPGGTTSTINFTDIKGYFKDIKLRQSKCLLYIIQFATNVVREAPFFTGYEILFSDSYKKEDLGK